MKPINIIFCLFFFILGLLLGCRGCGKAVSVEVKKTTTDTAVIILPPERSEPTQPELSNTKKDETFPFVTMPVPEMPIPAGDYDSLLVEFKALQTTLQEVWKMFDEQKNYNQTFRLKNGVVGFTGSVYQNNLFNLQASLDSVEQTTITKTVYQVEKKKNQFYLNLGGFYNSNVLSVGGDLLLKNKKDRIYHAGAYIGTDGRISYQAGTAFKISFKKQ